MKQKQLHIVVPDDQREQLRELAHKRRTSIAEEIRKAIAEYLKKEENEAGHGILQRAIDN